jgi:hypothetical protein
MEARNQYSPRIGGYRGYHDRTLRSGFMRLYFRSRCAQAESTRCCYPALRTSDHVRKYCLRRDLKLPNRIYDTRGINIPVSDETSHSSFTIGYSQLSFVLQRFPEAAHMPDASRKRRSVTEYWHTPPLNTYYGGRVAQMTDGEAQTTHPTRMI